MIKKLLNKSIAIFITFSIIFSLIPSFIFAQPAMPGSSLPNEVIGFNKAVFDSHFSRADREIDPQKWLEEAKLGVTRAILAWELIAGSFYDNPLLFNEAKEKLEKWSSDELEARFSDWLLSRFFGTAAVKAVMETTSDFSNIQKNYTWQLNEEGNIIFDDQTGDPLIIRPFDEDREFSEDLELWRIESNNIIFTNTEYFNTAMDSTISVLYTELLAFVPEELRITYGNIINETGINTSNMVKREFENIAVKEENILTSRRTRDILSLRKKSNDESAKIFTERLIAQTEETCNKNIQEINARIEQASAGTGDLVLLGEEWLALYKEQFDRGLKAWEEAEERFFTRYFEWELESDKLFDEGLAIWDEAFKKFNEERQKWEATVDELLAEGEKMFNSLSDELNKNITQARKEYQFMMDIRVEEGTARVKALVDMYLVCSSAALSAMESLKYWHDRYYYWAYVRPEDENYLDWLEEQLIEKIIYYYEIEKDEEENISEENDNIEEDNVDIADVEDEDEIIILTEASEVFDETRILISTEVIYKNDQTLLEMKKCHDLYLSYLDKAINARFEINENYETLFGSGILKDVLSPDVSTEDFCLDEYQLALIKAKAQVIYWEKKVDINEAVLAYANDFTAGRITEAEGIREWEKAKADYDNAIKLYEEKLKILSALGDNISKQQDILKNLLEEMAEEEAKLNRLNDDYTTLLTASIINRVGAFIDDINISYNYLVENYKILSETGEESDYWTTLEYGIQWDKAENSKILNNILELLYNGNDQGILSLSELENLAEENESWKINLDIRLAEIDLLKEGNTGSEWYFNAKGTEIEDGEELFERLVLDYQNSNEALFFSRLDLEIRLLEILLEEYDEYEEYDEEIYEVSYDNFIFEEEFAEDILEMLLILRENILLENEIKFEDEEKNMIAYLFVSGSSFFNNIDEYLSEYIYECDFSYNLLFAYIKYVEYSAFYRDELLQEMNNRLQDLFIYYDIGINEKFLPEISDICKAIYNKVPDKQSDFFNEVTSFLFEFENCFTNIPNWLINEIDLWKKSLIEYAGAYAFFNDIQSLSLLESIYDKETLLLEIYDECILKLELIDDYSIEEKEELNNEFKNICNDLYKLYINQQLILGLMSLEETVSDSKDDNHWRNYITENIIDKDKIDSIIVHKSTWKEGLLEDALFNSMYYSNRINDSFYLFLNNDINASSEFKDFYENNYYNYTKDNINNLNWIYSLYDGIATSGKRYDLSMLSGYDREMLLNATYEELRIQEELYDELSNKYFIEAAKFLSMGSSYDDQYIIVKEIYNNIEKTRYEYEKQDAIKKWASTAYLGTDHIDLDSYKENLLKSENVFNILSEIFSEKDKNVYENDAYYDLYSEYEISFIRKINIMEAEKILQSATTAERNNNNSLYYGYLNSLYGLGNYSGKLDNWKLTDNLLFKDIIIVKDNKLAFSTGAVDSQILNSYFLPDIKLDGERHSISGFDKALRELNDRMKVYFSDNGKYEQWSYARYYLLTNLINNYGLEHLSKYNYLLGEYGSEEKVWQIQVKDTPYASSKEIYETANIANQRDYAYMIAEDCWNRLSAEEKADLEFYTILTLTENVNNYYFGFSQIPTLNIYQHAYDYINGRYQYATDELEENEKGKFAITFASILFPWFGASELLRNRNLVDMQVLAQLAILEFSHPFNEKKSYVSNWTNKLMPALTANYNYIQSYKNSCNRLDKLEGIMPDGESVTWENIYETLRITGYFNKYDPDILKSYWDNMNNDMHTSFKTVPEALSGLFFWAERKETSIKLALENFWIEEEKSNKEKEKSFLILIDDYITGETEIEAVLLAAQELYGNNFLSWKIYYDNIYSVMYNNLSLYTDIGNKYTAMFSLLGAEISEITEKIYAYRYNAELAAREAEWEIEFMDLSNKFNEWLESAKLIINAGKNDWYKSEEKLQASFLQWQINFNKEKERVGKEWNEVYLAGLEDKEKWLEQAAQAVYTASTDSLLSLLGTEGERMSKFTDTREPLGIRDAIPEIESLMDELLSSSGITNMYSAFNSINAIMPVPVLRQGVGGPSAWNSALIKSTASDIARKSNKEIAERETKVLAAKAYDEAEKAIKTIKDSVISANIELRTSMDNAFIFNGLWGRSGNNYEKEIVKGSTWATPVISDIVVVEGYRDYVLEPIILNTKLDENTIANLDTLAIRLLIENVYLEIEEKLEEIFGHNEEKAKIVESDIYLENPRKQSPGLFGIHVGYASKLKPQEEWGETKESHFEDLGFGEVGRLITELSYWGIKDSEGKAELYLPTWEKRFWDSEHAPNLKLVSSIAASIASVVVSIVSFGTATPLAVAMIATTVVINTADDLLFALLDATYGYKTIREAHFEFGKALAINTATSVISAGFGAASAGLEVASTARKVATETLIKGVETATTTIATSVLNGFTYDADNGFGFSNEIVKAGLKDMHKSVAVSMAGTFTTSTLNGINSGLGNVKLAGFNPSQKYDIGNLNGLIGSLAGQGLNYALTGDFNLNILNLGLFTGGKVNVGLLELHLGKNGTSLNLGMGGANISIDNLVSAVKGMQVWNVNSQIGKYIKKNENFDSSITLRAQYGYGDDVQKDQLWDILKGEVTLMTDANGEFRGQTTIDANGNRVVTLGGYQLGMSMEDQMLLAVVLGHEAYRDGYVTSDNSLETRTATMAHTEMAIRMILSGEQLAYDSNLAKDIAAYFGGIDSFNSYVDSNYDSSTDYWKLTNEGYLEYDGFATLRDADGNILKSFRDMGLNNDLLVEDALLWLLNIDKNNTGNVSAVRDMALSSGINSNNLSLTNFGNTISINSIVELFTNINASGYNTNTSINRIYGSAIGFLNYADVGENTTIANAILSNYYDPTQMTMIQENQIWYNNALNNGIDINGMISGNAWRTSEFEELLVDLKVNKNNNSIEKFFSEAHTGLDYAGGEAVYSPGGNWVITNKDGHKAYFQLYGSELTMRIQHLDNNTISSLAVGTIYGNTSKLVNFPALSNGVGTGAHIHIDMTMNLPYNGIYQRQFINPETLQPGWRFEYGFVAKDNNYNVIRAGNYTRY